jgi:hypothetical protein
MSESPNLRLPYLLPSQAQKHVTHNEALRTLDAVVQVGVATRSLAAPPAAPGEGDRYIVAAGASGEWAGAGNSVAAFVDGAWMLHSPRIGWLAWVADESRLLVFDGTAWTAGAAGGANPAPLVGVNTTAAVPNRLAVKSDAILFNHDDATPGTGDMRVSVNKSAAARTASLIFQDNTSGRAELGLAGDDKLRGKVSPNGSVWTTAFEVDPANGYFVAPTRIGIGGVPTRVLEVAPASGNATAFFKGAGAVGCEIAHTPSGSLYFSVYDAAGAIVFNTTGASGQQWFYLNGALRMLISATGSVQFHTIGTTAAAANAVLDSASSNNLLRSTSSLAWKRDVEPVDIEHSRRLMTVRPIWYRSKAPADDPAHSFWGFAAEDVAAADPRMAIWGYREEDYEDVEVELRPATPEVRDRKTGNVIEPAVPADKARMRRPRKGAQKVPDGVAYDRFVVHHHMILNEQASTIAALEARLAALEAQGTRPGRRG